MGADETAAGTGEVPRLLNAGDRDILPRSCPHQISYYVIAPQAAGLEFQHLSEHIVNDELAALLSFGVEYVDVTEINQPQRHVILPGADKM